VPCVRASDDAAVGENGDAGREDSEEVVPEKVWEVGDGNSEGEGVKDAAGGLLM